MNFSIKTVLFGLLTLISFNSFGQLVYDNNQADTVQVTLLTGGGTYTFPLATDTSTSTNNTRTHSVYLPIGGNSGSIDNRNFSYFTNRAQLPQISGGTSGDNQNYLQFSLYLDVLGDFSYLNVGISTETSPTTYEVIGAIDFPSYGDGARLINIDLKDICDHDSDVFDCSKFNFTDNPSDNETLNLFFFLADGNLANATSITKADYSGVEYIVKWSNRVYTTLPRMTALAKGDSSLAATVDGFEMDDDFDSWFSYATTTTCSDVATNPSLGEIGINSASLTDLNNTTIDGTVRVSNLTNGTCYSVRLFLCDRYGFCSYGTEQMSGTPEEIQALLEKQACFFFTAGFNGEHYIVTFFQAWRDHVLMSSELGRSFVGWYYRTAPQYTPYILERPWLQNIIKGVGYFLYFLIKGWWIVLMAFTFILSLSLVQMQSRRINDGR